MKGITTKVNVKTNNYVPPVFDLLDKKYSDIIPKKYKGDFYLILYNKEKKIKTKSGLRKKNLLHLEISKNTAGHEADSYFFSMMAIQSLPGYNVKKTYININKEFANKVKKEVTELKEGIVYRYANIKDEKTIIQDLDTLLVGEINYDNLLSDLKD